MEQAGSDVVEPLGAGRVRSASGLGAGRMRARAGSERAGFEARVGSKRAGFEREELQRTGRAGSDLPEASSGSCRISEDSCESAMGLRAKRKVQG